MIALYFGELASLVVVPLNVPSISPDERTNKIRAACCWGSSTSRLRRVFMLRVCVSTIMIYILEPVTNRKSTEDRPEADQNNMGAIMARSRNQNGKGWTWTGVWCTLRQNRRRPSGNSCT